MKPAWGNNVLEYVTTHECMYAMAEEFGTWLSQGVEHVSGMALVTGGHKRA